MSDTRSPVTDGRCAAASGFSHLDAQGHVRMVDVGAKAVSERVAVAEGFIELAPETVRLLAERALPKGDALACARVAGILAAKRTAELIPLCHSLPLTFADVRFEVRADGVRIEAEARTVARTGVEMEAIVAVQCAAATLYDMCKAVQRDMRITGVRLLAKSGGRSGDYRAPGVSAC